MNGVHPRIMKTGTIIWCNGDPPPQGLSEARWGDEVSFILISVVDPPRGAPFWGGGVYRNWGYGVLNPHQHQ